MRRVAPADGDRIDAHLAAPIEIRSCPRKRASSSLGRGLISAQPEADGCKLNEGEVVGRKFVVPRCHAATVLDPVEEPPGRNAPESGLVMLTLSFVDHDPARKSMNDLAKSHFAANHILCDI